MVFGFLKKKAAISKKATDPLAVFDAVISSVERQGGEQEAPKLQL